VRPAYRRWLLEVWGAGCYELLDEVFAEDLLDHNRATGQPAGRAGDEWAARIVRAAFPDLRFTIDVCLAEGDLVTGRWTMTGTNTGPLAFFDLPPTGRPVTMTGQEIFRVDDGRVREIWHVEDIGTMLDHLGLTPPRRVMRLAAQMSARRFRRGR
jgi:predicted ester cyclase